MRNSHYSSSRAYTSPTQFVNPLAIQTNFSSFDNGLTSPTSPTSSISSNGGDMFDFNDDFYLPTADSLFDDSWLSYQNTSSPQASPTFYNSNQHHYLDTITEELEAPINTRPAKRRKTQVEPCNCCYCQVPSTPSESSVPSSRKSSNAGKIGSTSGGGVMQPSPPLQLQFQIELCPSPTIIGYEALGADSVFLQQQLQTQQARQYVKPSAGYESGRIHDGFDGRPFFGDARTYL